MVIVFFREDPAAASPVFTLHWRRLAAATIILLAFLSIAVYGSARLLAMHWLSSPPPEAAEWVRAHSAAAAKDGRRQWLAERDNVYRQMAEVQARINNLRAEGKLIARRLHLPAAILDGADGDCRVFQSVAAAEAPELFAAAPWRENLRAAEAVLSTLDGHYAFLLQQSALETVLQDTIPMEKPILGESWRSSAYGFRAHPVTGRRSFHSGDDLAAKSGTPVLAAASGVVLFRGRLGYYGNTVQLLHGRGVSTIYGHLRDVHVEPRQYVRRGEIIGSVGRTGRSTGPHLHYEVRVDNRPRPVRGTIRKLRKARTRNSS